VRRVGGNGGPGIRVRTPGSRAERGTMGTITMTGFNNIDWNTVLQAVMTQESQPLTYMQQQRTALSSRSTAYGVLAGWVGALKSKADDLASAASLGGRSASSTDQTTVAASASSQAQIGTYDVVVSKLARAQVTTTTAASAVASPTTVVASGGSITINGKTVTLAGDTSLQELSDAINATADIGVRSTVVAADGKYQMVLTGTQTGQTHAFTVTNDLVNPTGLATPLAFSGTNAVDARDAELTVNNVRVTSATNTITGAISGVTLTLYKESASPTVISVGQDASGTKAKVKGFVSAYNDLVGYLKSQNETAKNGDTGSIGRDTMLRAMRAELNGAILSTGPSSSALQNLTEIGVEFQRDGTLTFNEATFDQQAETNLAGVEQLLSGSGTADGVFDTIKTAISQYTDSSGLLLSAKTRLTDELTKLDDRISDMQERLAIRRQTLVKEYAAADAAIAALNTQGNTLTSLAAG
jgi:flagellar hook-associated protein 2